MQAIKLDEITKKNLMEIARFIEESQIKINIICQTYLNAKEAKGNYALSKDFSELTPVNEDN